MINYGLFTHSDRHIHNWRRKSCLLSFFLFFNVWPHTVISLCTAYWGSHYENADVDWTHLLDFPGIQATHSPLGNLAALLSSAPPSSTSDKTRQTSNYFSIFLPKKMSSLSSENTPQITKQNKISHRGEKPILFFLFTYMFVFLGPSQRQVLLDRVSHLLDFVILHW